MRRLILALLLSVSPLAAQQWAGVLNSPRGTNWSLAGIPGGLPDTNWAQCGSTVAVGTSNTTINTLLAACPVNTFLLLGPGTFNLSGAINLPSHGHVVLRGTGASATILNFSSNAGNNCSGGFLCTAGSGGSNVYRGRNYSNMTIHNVTGGLSQGSTVITLDSASGITANATTIVMNQCDTGITGSDCKTGSEIDNGGYWECVTAWTSLGHGCTVSTEGPDGNSWRCTIAGTGDCQVTNAGLAWQVEQFMVTAVNGLNVTLNRPIRMPNWSTGQSPVVILNNPTQQVGWENFQVKVPNSQGTANMSKCYNCWVSGVSFINGGRILSFLGNINSVIMNSYFYGIPSGGDQPAIDIHDGSSNLVVNNICQGTSGCTFQDGPEDGDVFAYNYATGIGAHSGNSLSSFYESHSAGDNFTLLEGNIGPRGNDDIDHGTHLNQSYFRNFFYGYDNWLNLQSIRAATQPGILVDPIQQGYGTRYSAFVANVFGVKGYHNQYMAPVNTNAFASQKIYILGYASTSAGPPGDTIGQCGTASGSTATFTDLCWANYDTVNAATRMSTLEVPTAAQSYPNSVPTACTTTSNCMPSWFLTSRPSWWAASIPYPAIGYDVTGGNLGQCTGAFFTVSQSGLPASANSQCSTGARDMTAWAGHVNANPAMAYYLQLGGLPDGSGPALVAFDASHYAGGPVIVAPNPPSNLNVTAAGSNINLTWTLPSGTFTGETVYRSTTHGGPYTAIASGLTGTSYSDTPGNGTFFYVITAFNGGNVSTVSGNGSTATVTCMTACSFPTGSAFTLAGNSAAAFNVSTTVASQPTGSTFTFASSSGSVGSGGGAWISGAQSTQSNEVNATLPVNLTVSLLPASTSFGTLLVGNTSAPQTVTLTNTSPSGNIVTLSGIGIGGTNPGDFAQTNNCPLTLSSGAACQIQVTATPQAAGARSGTVTVTDNAAGSPQSVSLSVTGTSALPGASLTPASITFGAQLVSTPSSAVGVTLTNTGTGTLTISSIVTSGDFSNGTTCGATLGPGLNCSINVTFTPSAQGTRTGTLTVTDNAASSPQTVSLAGVGVTSIINLTGTVTISGPTTGP